MALDSEPWKRNKKVAIKPLFASLRWPPQTGDSLEALDMTVHERNVREAYRRFKTGLHRVEIGADIW